MTTKVVSNVGEGKASHRGYVIDHITSKVIQLLESGEIPWRKPWSINGVMPTNLVTKKEYRGANAFLLSMYREFSTPYFVSFKQAKDLGGSVKAGSKSIPIVFWKWIKDEEDERPIVRYYSVFNVEQCDGLSDKIPEITAQTWNNTPIERGEKLIQDMLDKPEIRFGNVASYNPTSDMVTVPELKYFENQAEYYSTLFHEITHSTGHKSRLSRLTEKAAFGTAVYSKEELIAEFGAAYLCGVCDISNDNSIYNTAGYIQGWLKRLRDDKRMIIYAAAAAQKAVDFVLNKQTC